MLCFVFAALVVLLDQFIKRWVLLTLALHEPMELIPGVVGLTNVPNTGAAFSILENQRWLLIGIAVVAALLLIAILLRYNDGFWSTLGLSAVLGGTIGNLVDRILLSYVVDIFELQFMRFAIFNIADIFITLGGITFLIHFIVSSLRSDRSAQRITGEVPEEYAQYERPHIEEEIGLYDFQYGEDADDEEQYDYDDLTDSGVIPGRNTEPEREPSVAYNEPDPDLHAYDPSYSSVTTLNALNELEQELQETAGLEDYNVDDLLREYGFEDDEN